MKKLEDLRNYLIKQVPGLKRNPEQLLTFIEDGQIRFHQGDNYSHRYRFQATVIITDLTQSTDTVVIPVLEWLNIREPGFNPETALTFEAEILANGKIDLQLRIEMTERVVVTFENGVRTITHVLPPVPLRMNEDAELTVENLQEP